MARPYALRGCKDVHSVSLDMLTGNQVSAKPLSTWCIFRKDFTLRSMATWAGHSQTASCTWRRPCHGCPCDSQADVIHWLDWGFVHYAIRTGCFAWWIDQVAPHSRAPLSQLGCHYSRMGWSESRYLQPAAPSSQQSADCFLQSIFFGELLAPAGRFSKHFGVVHNSPPVWSTCWQPRLWVCSPWLVILGGYHYWSVLDCTIVEPAGT